MQSPVIGFSVLGCGYGDPVCRLRLPGGLAEALVVGVLGDGQDGSLPWYSFKISHLVDDVAPC